MTAANLQDCAVLSNGVKMPWLGLGVYQSKEGQEVINAVKWAIEAGYRSIDTAAIYRNEEGVGQAIKEAGIPREELFITTKVWNSDQGFNTTIEAFQDSLQRLGLEYIDLYLIHWPEAGTFKDTWKALEKLYKDGKVRAIGVSNFNVEHLEELMADAEVKPMINQVEYHPRLTQEALQQFCKDNGIQLQAWSPLMRGKLMEHPVVMKIADAHQKTPAQVIIRWDLQNEVITIPKSVTQKRIVENADVFDFELSENEMKNIQALNTNERVGPDPADFDFTGVVMKR